MFVNGNSNHKGNIAEAAVALAATKLGIPVLRPLTEHTRYDMVFDLGPELLRVQCKWALRKGNVVVVNLMSSRYKANGVQVRLPYTPAEIDAVGVYCEEVDACYLLPIEKVAGMRAMHLRLEPAKSSQRAALNWAADYRLGAVAQLARARAWQARGRGFESHQLHLPGGEPSAPVGIDEFRDRFGWYMERARDGERFLITRRGKPHVRLSPPE